MQQRLTQGINVDSLSVQEYDTKVAMSQTSAKFVANKLQAVLTKDAHANLLLATGASQLEFLSALSSIESIDWSAVTTYHLDEYVGISREHPASFRKYLHDYIIDKVQPAESYFLRGQSDPQDYTALLKELVQNLRQDLGYSVYFVAGKLGKWRNSSNK